SHRRRGRALRSPLPQRARGGARARPDRAQGRGPPRQGRRRPGARARHEVARARRRAGVAAPSNPRPRDRRLRPARARLLGRAAGRRGAVATPRRGRRRADAQHARLAARPSEGARVTHFRWGAAGPYEVVFTTRVGGVSDGPYASLNLGRRTGDDVERVDENRRRACAEIGADAEALALNYQVHSSIVHRARAGTRGEKGDGLWTEEPDLPVLAMSADCVPVAV